MNERQQYALSLAEKGRNIFVTGGAGTGKTYFIKNLVLALRRQGKQVGVTSMTANSALLIHGKTLHSYLGIGISRDTQDMMTKVRKYRKVKTWLSTDVLVIDEVSMLSKELFESIDYIAKELIQNPRPFGGIQVVLCGDFCQLGCIGSDEFCFESSLWDRYITETVVFTHTFRQQNDPLFCQVLESIRFGDMTSEMEEVLLSRKKEFDLQDTEGIEPTKLYSYRKDVSAINETHLSQLIHDKQEKAMKFNVRSTMKREKLEKYCTDPTITLCTNAQVILTVNLDVENGLVNGSRGVVKGFCGGIPIVKFVNGGTRTIDYYTYSTEDDTKTTISYSQIPLILGWAITIHRSQGMTLDNVMTDLSNVFDYGQGYVTLSRVRNLENLWITGIDFSKLKCNPKVIEFYQSLKKEKNVSS